MVVEENYRYVLAVIFILIGHTLMVGQNDFYRGGPGDGYGSDSISNIQSMVGYGGHGDGYAANSILDNNSITSFGGQGDGYSAASFDNNLSLVGIGGYGDGYSAVSIENNNSLVGFGGHGDGYAGNFFIQVIWTGVVSSSWNNNRNWSSNEVPVPSDHVVIPLVNTHYPMIDDQLLSIGYPTASNGPSCATLWIQSGAILTSGPNSFMINLSTITIDGSFIWNNPKTGSFRNNPGGKILINSGATLNLNN